MDDMTAQMAEVRERIRNIVTRWITPMGLNWWDVEVKFVYQAPLADSSFLTIARADVEWEYKLASITFYVPEMVDMEDKELEEIVVHEMVHILVAPIQQDDGNQQMTEFGITLLTDALLWVRDYAARGEMSLED